MIEWAGLSSGIGSLLGAVAGYLLVRRRINRLEEKVDIHNGYAEKFVDIQKQFTEQTLAMSEIKDLIIQMHATEWNGEERRKG